MERTASVPASEDLLHLLHLGAERASSELEWASSDLMLPKAISSERGPAQQRRRRNQLCGLGTFILLTALVLIMTLTGDSGARRTGGSLFPFTLGTAKTAKPFSGDFARFPTVSSLPAHHRRLTGISVWTGTKSAGHMHIFMHSAQGNAKSLDLLFVNRQGPVGPGAGCVDFKKEGIDITWGGNVKVLCLTDEEWALKHLDFLCGPDGWRCNATQRNEVLKELRIRLGEDKANVAFKPLLGDIFKADFVHPRNPFWAWLDVVSLPKWVDGLRGQAMMSGSDG